ncbi:hypothetical protein AHAS_Ahas19G0155100 [Arachis hypogaea]
MTRSLSDSSLTPFGPEIERTLTHIRQARCQLAFVNSESGLLEEHTNSLSPSIRDHHSSINEKTLYSSAGSAEFSLSDSGDNTMADPPRRITLREVRAPDINLQPIQIRYPALDPNFELKNGMINLLPKDSGLPREDPLKHLNDFQVACSTARRHGADKVAALVFTFPFSLEEKVKEWFYTQPREWRIPHQKQDCRGSLGDHSGFGGSTQHSRVRNPQPKALSEVSPSGDAILTKTLGEMTILLRQITQGQQIPQVLLSPPPQPPRMEGPPRSCGICACNNHYTDEFPQLQEDTTLAVANPYPQRSNYNQGTPQHEGNQNQGWRDNLNQR